METIRRRINYDRYSFINDKDLIKSELLIHKKQLYIDSLLGVPEISIKNNRQYLVKEVYSLDIDPDAIIYMSIHFDNLGYSDKVELITVK